MADNDDVETPERVKRVTFTLRPADVALLRRIVRQRHGNEPRSLSLTMRELIREEYARGSYEEATGK